MLTAADAAVREGARKTFDGLPVTLRTLRRSRPYALPRALQPPAARSGDPDLTYVAALDRTQLRPAADRLPRRTDNTVEVALPQTAARAPRVRPGDRLALTDLDHQARPVAGQDSIPLVGVDPRAYGELTARTDLGRFPASALRTRPRPLPAGASPSVASAYGTRRPFPVRLSDGSMVTV